MNPKPLITLVFFLFIFIFWSAPTLAYYPINLEVNTSLSGFNYRALRCLNQTDNNVYCYAIGEDYISRFNATLGDKKTCQTPLSYTPYGGAVLDENTACIVYGAYTKCFNITSIASGGSCPEVSTLSSVKSLGGNSPVTGVKYTVNNWTYWTGENYIRLGDNLTDTAFYPQNLYSPYEDSGSISLPNHASNTTLYYTYLYGAQTGETEIYTNGAYVKTTSSINELWGLTNYSYTDIIKVGSTEYMFILTENKYGSTDTLYRVNFTQAQSFIASSLIPISPLEGQTVKLTTQDYVPLIVNLSTPMNGTLYFYYNGIYLTETKINLTNVNNLVFSASAPYNGTAGTYNYRAFFVDSNNVQWSTPTITFYIKSGVTANDLLNNPGPSFALLVGGWFGVSDQETSENITSILLALIGSIIFSMLASIYAGIKGNASAMVFMTSFMAFIVFFTMLGWLNPAVMVILVILVGFLIAKMLGMGGG